MPINPVTDSSVWIGQHFPLNQPASPASTGVQESGGYRSPVGTEYHHQHGGMGRALMQTLKQLLLSVPSGSNIQSSSEDIYDAGQNVAGSEVSSIRHDMHDFMYALFQAIRSEEPSLPLNAGSYAAASDSSKFERGLASLISTLAGNATEDNSKIADLENAFNTLLTGLQNSSSEGTSRQPSGTLDLQKFLSMLQQNLLSYRQPVSATGNVLNALG